MADVFLTITAIAMLAGVVLGLLMLVVLAAVIPYQAFVKREKSLRWYLKALALPFCCFAFSALMFLVRSFSPNFFGMPGGIKLTSEVTHTVDGKIVHSDKEEREISIEKSTEE